MSGQAARLLRGEGTVSRKTGCQEDKRSGYYNQFVGVETPTYKSDRSRVEHGMTILSPRERVRERGRKFGFTLAEVLITLGIIGVVAALTLPSLISSYKERATVVKVKQAYSLLNQAVAKMIEEHGTLDTWTDDSKAFFEQELNKQLNVVEEEKCAYPNCSYAHYVWDKKYLLSNGMVISTEGRNLNNVSGHSCFGSVNDSGWMLYYGVCAFISVDINGKQKPNKKGQDAFNFLVYKDGIKPYGLSEKLMHELYSFKSCGAGGGNCTAWVIYNENLDYLRCRDKLSFEGAHSCKEAK